MFEFRLPTTATLTSVTPRTEVHGEDRVFAISLGLKLTGPNTLLDKLSPTLRHALYMQVPGQENLPGIEEATPLLRSKLIEEVKIGPSSLEGWTLAVDHGIDETAPIKIGGCRVDKFRCTPMEGGSIELLFRVGSNDIDATEAGLLCSHLSQEIDFTLIAPEKQADPTDGTTAAFQKDHPDATDLFVNGAGPGDDGETEGSEGGELDVEAGGDDEGAPQDLEDRLDGALARGGNTGTTRAPKGSRTARGREKTAKALKAGKAAAALGA